MWETWRTRRGRRYLPPEVEGCRKLVAQKAWATWMKLPPTVKAWIGVEDLIDEGLAFACHRALPMWSAKRSGKFITFLWHTLENYYRTVHLEHHYADMRCDSIKVKDRLGNVKLQGSRVISIQAAQEKLRQEGKGTEFERVLRMPPVEVDFLVSCHVIKSFTGLWKESSTELQNALVRWFLRPVGTKYNTTGRRFIENSREFRELASTYQLDINDCRHLIRSPECLDKVSRELLWVPYDLDNPTPGIRPLIIPGVSRSLLN